MIDCDYCGNPIGSEADPIFVDSIEATCCRECYIEEEGTAPKEEDGQIDKIDEEDKDS